METDGGGVKGMRKTTEDHSGQAKPREELTARGRDRQESLNGDRRDDETITIGELDQKGLMF